MSATVPGPTTLLRPDVLVVLNPAAGGAGEERTLPALEAVLRARGLAHRVIETSRAPDVRERVRDAVREAIAAGCRRIVVAGGDGTVALAASALPDPGTGPPIPIGIVPAGTANVLAHELGLPADTGQAARLAVEGADTIDLDAIALDGGRVLTQIGVGADAAMIRGTLREEQRRLGRLAYVRAFVARALRQRPHEFTLTVDGVALRARAWQLVVANAGTFGVPPFTWGPRIDPADGLLDVCIYDARTVSDYLHLAWRILTGHRRRDPRTRFLRVRRRLEIRAERPVTAQGDGEIVGHTPFALAIEPASVRIVVARPVPRPEPPPPGAEAKVAEEVETMLAQHSRTWPLQGARRHPWTALAALDAALFLRLNRVHLRRGVDRALLRLSWTMHYGEGWALVALAMLAVDPGRGLRAVAEALPVLWLTMLTVNLALKRAFRRRRPFLAYVRARVLGRRPRDFSMPSGHSAAAFAGALLFGAHAPALAPLFYAIAALVALTRVYLGVHYPSDVLFGAAAGTALAVLYRALIHLVPGWPW